LNINVQERRQMSSGFRFKQFSVDHDRCAMKVGTDGVLLGAWADSGVQGPALDVGSGSGLIALMLAQRGFSPVHAVETDADAYVQCAENFSRSNWAGSLSAFNIDYREFIPPDDITYRLIASNPPFFNNALRSPSPTRNSARHTDSLSWNDLAAKSADILAGDGTFCVIIPYDGAETFERTASMHGLHLSHRTIVIPREGKSPERALLRFSKSDAEPLTDTLTILSQDGTYTPEYRKLTAEFYLKF
jgi:tRNA1Val (adenine37-N6)-methyltransferase